MHTIRETLSIVRDLGKVKSDKSFIEVTVLSIIAGAAISFGYIAYFIAREQVGGGLGFIIGASLFPIGLMIVLMAGGELLTGNMMVVGTATLHQDVSLPKMLRNWIHVFFGNMIGAFLVSFFFVFIVNTIDPSSTIVQQTAMAKLSDSPLQMFISGVGCNIFVGLSVWIYLGAKDGFLKFMGIWFPIMIFVILGYQHVVANMFVLSIPLFQNTISITHYLANMLFVFLGNASGGVLLVGGLYALATGSLKH